MVEAGSCGRHLLAVALSFSPDRFVVSSRVPAFRHSRRPACLVGPYSASLVVQTEPLEPSRRNAGVPASPKAGTPARPYARGGLVLRTGRRDTPIPLCEGGYRWIKKWPAGTQAFRRPRGREHPHAGMLEGRRYADSAAREGG